LVVAEKLEENDQHSALNSQGIRKGPESFCDYPEWGKNLVSYSHGVEISETQNLILGTIE
jgi:hypothetical protein